MIEKLKIAGFANLSKKELTAIYKAALGKKIAAGGLIIREGDWDRTFYLIVEGTVGIYKKTSGSDFLVDTLGAGDWVGEIAMLRKTPRVASAIAVKPSLLLAFTPEAFATLPEKLQLHIQKELVGLAAVRLERLQTLTMHAAEKMGKLGVYVDTMSVKAAAECVQSDIVQEVVRKIPKLPRYAGDFAAKLMDEKVSLIEAVDSIKTDPSLTAMILKTINSPYYGLREKIVDIQRASLFLGATQMYNLVVEGGLKSVMPKTEEFLSLQKHSYLVSVIAYEISGIADRKSASSVNCTIGLMHDIGRSVILLLEKQNPRMKSLVALLNDAQLGAHLLNSWGLPEKLSNPVKMHRHPEFVPPEKLPDDVRDNVSVLHVAHCCADRLMNGADSDLKEIYIDNYLGYLGLRMHSCMELMEDKIVPLLEKNRQSYPQWIRDMLDGRRKAA
jgi:HD-like signal output (HDOD) protein